MRPISYLFILAFLFQTSCNKEIINEIKIQGISKVSSSSVSIGYSYRCSQGLSFYSFDVYRSTTPVRPLTPYRSYNGAPQQLIIDGLTDNTQYYFWLSMNFRESVSYSQSQPFYLLGSGTVSGNPTCICGNTNSGGECNLQNNDYGVKIQCYNENGNYLQNVNCTAVATNNGMLLVVAQDPSGSYITHYGAYELSDFRFKKEDTAGVQIVPLTIILTAIEVYTVAKGVIDLVNGIDVTEETYETNSGLVKRHRYHADVDDLWGALSLVLPGPKVFKNKTANRIFQLAFGWGLDGLKMAISNRFDFMENDLFEYYWYEDASGKIVSPVYLEREQQAQLQVTRIKTGNNSLNDCPFNNGPNGSEVFIDIDAPSTTHDYFQTANSLTFQLLDYNDVVISTLDIDNFNYSSSGLMNNLLCLRFGSEEYLTARFRFHFDNNDSDWYYTSFKRPNGANKTDKGVAVATSFSHSQNTLQLHQQ